MARTEQLRYAFNRGLISSLALARVDLKRAALSNKLQDNWMPRKLGSMMLRPGTQWVGNTRADAASRSIAFVRSLTARHIMEFTTGVMRIWTADALLTRVAVGAAVINGDFIGSLAFWTNNSDVGGTTSYNAGDYLSLVGNGTAAARERQAVAVTAGQENTEHALRIVIARGPVVFRLGSTAGGDQLINETTLYTGTHSLAFTPGAATFYIEFNSTLKRQVLVKSCNVEAAGVMELTSPYLAADLDYIRADENSLSVDVQFMACRSYQQRRIERRALGRSWSITLYQPEDGPFRNANTGTLTMQSTVLSGNGSLVSSRAFFNTGHVGALFRLASVGQLRTVTMTAANMVSGSIRVTGVGASRYFTYTITGLTATGNTVVIQSSFDDATWTDSPGNTFVADTTLTGTDGLDNQIVYYRLKCTVYAAGATVGTLSYAFGSITGIARATGIISSQQLLIEVLVDFGGITASNDWSEGLWSDYRGWPSTGTLYEGRMSWAGYGMYELSVSDAFASFDQETVGDSGPIIRSIGSGPLENINWMLPLQRLILGGEMAEHSVRSNSFDEPITPTNNNRKAPSSRGSAPVQAIKHGQRGYFIQRGGSRAMELLFDINGMDYTSREISVMCPEVLKGGDEGTAYVVRMAMQQQPDDRVHYILSNGTAVVLVLDDAEKLECFVTVSFPTGAIEDVVILPGAAGQSEDQVYYTVRFTVGGATVRFFLKWALEAQCQGGIVNEVQTGVPNRQADAFVVCAGGSAVLSGIAHLTGQQVVCWANGKDQGTFTVQLGGTITVPEVVDANGAIVGLGYQALMRSAKLGQTLSKQKSIDHVSMVLYNTHYQGLEVGQDFTTMDNLPLVKDGAALPADTIHTSYDTAPQVFPGKWDVDARLCLRATAPRPCTVLAANLEGQVT